VRPTFWAPLSRQLPLGAAVLAFVPLSATLLACKSDKKPTPTEGGGTQKACEVRKTWEHAIRRDCTTCLVKAAVPKCGDCSAKDYDGMCSAEDAAKRAEPTCGEIHKCVYNCKIDDCDCLARCYEGKEACEKLAGALDECTTKVCDVYCR
jgi:hypothetical protein